MMYNRRYNFVLPFQVKFIALDPKTLIWPHTGSTNCRLRVVIPLALAKETSLRVAEATR